MKFLLKDLLHSMMCFSHNFFSHSSTEKEKVCRNLRFKRTPGKLDLVRKKTFERQLLSSKCHWQRNLQKQTCQYHRLYIKINDMTAPQKGRV